MIKSFTDRQTAAIFQGLRVHRIDVNVQRKALMKLIQLDAATMLDDMRIPPGNRLEQLSGKRHEQFSIRVNQQWRICFKWQEGHAFDVEFCDYH